MAFAYDLTRDETRDDAPVVMRVVPLADVDLAHVVDEGEGDTSVAEWRAGHERFWHGEEVRRALEDPGFTVDDTTQVVLERFRLIADLRLDDRADANTP